MEKLVSGLVGRFKCEKNSPLSSSHLHWAAVTVFEVKQKPNGRLPDVDTCPSDTSAFTAKWESWDLQRRSTFFEALILILKEKTYLAGLVSSIEPE